MFAFSLVALVGGGLLLALLILLVVWMCRR